MSRFQDENSAPNAEERQWIDENAARQKQRYERIVADMDAMSDQRDAWIEAFLGRIQERGFNYNGDLLRRISADDIPEKPRRPFKVVY